MKRNYNFFLSKIKEYEISPWKSSLEVIDGYPLLCHHSDDVKPKWRDFIPHPRLRQGFEKGEGGALSPPFPPSFPDNQSINNARDRPAHFRMAS